MVPLVSNISTSLGHEDWPPPSQSIPQSRERLFDGWRNIVHPDQGLDLALERMGANQIEIFPVVNRADVHKLEGVVTLRDVLNAYGVNRT